jgi:tRNA-splicing ligase RtcB
MMPRLLASPPGAAPILAWARAVPAGAVKQLQHIASQPYVFEHVAAMPDVHMAEGVAVGTVFATERHIVPGALGGISAAG